MKQLPIIDFAGYLHGDKAAQEAVVHQIYDACTKIGFFYLTGHGVPQSVIDDAFAASREFFAIPDNRKTEVRVDVNFRGHKPLEMKAGLDGNRRAHAAEIFTIGMDVPAGDPLAGQPGYGPNHWPGAMPSLKPRLEAYFGAVRSLSEKILEAMAKSLDIDPQFFKPKYAKPTSSCVMLHYPSLPADAPRGTESGDAHTDWGAVTVLYQDNVGGLQAKNRDGQWVEGTPVPGAFVVNIGDMLMRWSNDRFISTPHRVINRSGKDRYSIATFLNPQSDAIVDPCELGVTEEQSAHPPVSAGKYIAARWADYYGRQSA